MAFPLRSGQPNPVEYEQQPDGESVPLHLQPYPYKMPTAEELAEIPPEELARMDAEDRQYDPPGMDWDRIIDESEADRQAGRVMTMDEFIRVTTENAAKIARMTPEELDRAIANGGVLR